MTPDDLFDDLVRSKELISYGLAYEALVGPRPARWLNAIHNREVIDRACTTAYRSINGVTARLDALIVSKARRRPGKGHYRSAPYSESVWLSTFANWSFRA